MILMLVLSYGRAEDGAVPEATAADADSVYCAEGADVDAELALSWSDPRVGELALNVPASSEVDYALFARWHLDAEDLEWSVGSVFGFDDATQLVSIDIPDVACAFWRDAERRGDSSLVVTLRTKLASTEARTSASPLYVELDTDCGAVFAESNPNEEEEAPL